MKARNRKILDFQWDEKWVHKETMRREGQLKLDKKWKQIIELEATWGTLKEKSGSKTEQSTSKMEHEKINWLTIRNGKEDLWDIRKTIQ